MTSDHARALIEQVQRDRDDLLRQVARFDQVIADLTALYRLEPQPERSPMSAPAATTVDSYVRDSPVTTLADRATGQRTAGRGITNETILAVLQTASPTWLNVESLAEAAISRGWGSDLDDPVSVIRTAVRRLAVADGSPLQRRSSQSGRGYEYRFMQADDQRLDAPADPEPPATQAEGQDNSSWQTIELEESRDPSPEVVTTAP